MSDCGPGLNHCLNRYQSLIQYQYQSQSLYQCHRCQCQELGLGLDQVLGLEEHKGHQLLLYQQCRYNHQLTQQYKFQLPI